ncbi:MAG: hypothetical protein NTY38_08975 [Acidobacteria bacterium]|nr:hypothetical protein [Acidobacteriota bacterium]
MSFSISPTTVDTSSGPVTLNVRIAASDDLSGFGSGSTGNGSIDLRQPSGGNPFGRGSLPITGGTNLNPIFEFTLTVPQFSPSGPYPISIVLVDNVFNIQRVSPSDLAARGFPSAITVVTNQTNSTVSTVATIPHLATGEGWQTTVRTSGVCVDGCSVDTITYNSNGAVLNTTTANIAASQSTWAKVTVLPSTQALQTGWIEVKANAKSPVGLCASALFTNSISKQEASSASDCIQPSGWESGGAGGAQYFYSHLSGYASGVALLNKATVSLSVLLQWRDESGNVLANRTVPLLPKQQTSFTTTEPAGRYGRFVVTPDPSMTLVQQQEFAKSVYSLGFQFSPFGSFTQLAPID